MPMDRGTPDLVRHCVAAVAKQYGGDTSKAFAICVAQLQKNGYLKPGTMELTAAGKAKEKEHEAEPDAAKKLKAYEKLLKANRKEESTADFDRLMSPSERSGFEDLPRGVSRRYETVSKQESSMDAMRRLAGIGSRYSDHTVSEAAGGSPQEMLAAALKTKKLPTKDGGERMASADEFALMMPTPMQGKWQFKHHDSRNYVFIDAKTGKLIVPKENRPFMRGEFDVFESVAPSGGVAAVAAKIADLTDANNHTEAVQALADFVFPKGHKHRKVMAAAVALEDAYGELPPGIAEIRKEVLKAAMAAAKKAGMDVAALEKAF